VRIELALDRGWIDARDRRETIREVELELLAGQVSDLFTAVSGLQASLLAAPGGAQQIRKGLSAAGRRTCFVATKALAWAGEATMSTIAAFRLLALACVNHLQSNEKGGL
jgi:inorganic triphosphatase YgiF